MPLLSISILLYKRKVVLKNEKSNIRNLHPFIDPDKGYTGYSEWQMEDPNYVFIDV